MMKAQVLKRFSHAGVEYAKGAIVDLSENQFTDWKAARLVGKAPEKLDKVKLTD